MGGRVLPSLQIKQGVTNMAVIEMTVHKAALNGDVAITGRRGREIFPYLKI